MVTKKFTIPVLPPFRLDLTAWTLRRRAKNEIDQWDGKRYSRILVIDNRAVRVLVEQHAAAELTVTTSSEQHSEAAATTVKATLQKMFSVATNLAPFYHLSARDTQLQPLAQMFKGVKPPRFPTIFEALINSIACQQISLDAGISLLNKLAENYGLEYNDGQETQYAFPQPEDLCSISKEEMRKLGFSRQKTRAIAELATNLVEQRLDLSTLDAAPNVEIVKILTQNWGIGRWSAEYTLLRGFGRLDILPGDDVGAQKNLMGLLELAARPNYDQIKALAQRWQPYAGLVYFHLLLEKLQEKGMLDGYESKGMMSRCERST